MPAIGWGSFRLKGPAVFEGVKMALGLGYVLLDSASSYKDEAAVREGIRAASPAVKRTGVLFSVAIVLLMCC